MLGAYPQQQAALLDLYDPDRSRTVTNGGQVSTYPLLMSALDNALQIERTRGGARLRIVTQSATSPTLIFQLEELLRQFPQAQ